eukprot:1161368-Pelagomonas_calceolata.AAC.2
MHACACVRRGKLWLGKGPLTLVEFHALHANMWLVPKTRLCVHAVLSTRFLKFPVTETVPNQPRREPQFSPPKLHI